MLLRPYYTGKSEIKKQERIGYPCRGVLHTPHKYPIKDYFMLHKYMSSPPSAVFVGRMQYAPTNPGTLIFQKLDRTRVGAYRIRPTNVSKGNEETHRYTKTIFRRLRRRLGNVFFCAPTYLGTLIF